MLQYRFSVIGECQIAKVDAASYSRLQVSFRLVLDSGDRFEHDIKAFERSRSSLIEIHDITERDKVPDHSLQIKNERSKIAGRDLAANCHRHAHRDDDDKSQADKKEKHRPHCGGIFYESDILIGILAVQDLKLFDL